jgi:hypothetical protein
MTTPDESAQHLIDAANTFVDVIEQENDALQTARVSDLPALQDAKLTASEIYESRLQDAINQGAAPERLSPAMRTALAKCQARFEDVTRRNVNNLKAAMELNRQLVGTIAQSIERQRVNASGYTKTGAMSGGPATHNPRDTVPVSLNKSC